MNRTAIAAATTLAGLAGTAAFIAWLRRRLAVIDVDGPSMRPTLNAGDRVLVRRRPLRYVRAGDIVVVENPQGHQTSHHPAAAARESRNLFGHTWSIKRVGAVPGDPVPASVAATVSAAPGTPVPDGCLIVLGDNPAKSFDSRHYGYLSGNCVIGVVVRCLPPPEPACSLVGDGP
jgi:signal peptidase I